MIENLIIESEKELKEKYSEIDEIECFYSNKVIEAFHKYKISDYHFNTTSGYGYNDIGRDVIDEVYSYLFNTEDALVRTNLLSGTHAINTALFAVLRPNDVMISITGKPYDTLDNIIGLNENHSSLKSFNISYEQIDLINNDFNKEKIIQRLNKSFVKVIYIQRSKGYFLRKCITVNQINDIYEIIKKTSPNTIVIVDNCYTEMTTKEEVKSDLLIGSLIKNLGAGICSSGGYITGKKELIKLCSERLTTASGGKEVGSGNNNKEILLGLYHAPHVISSSMKIKFLTLKVFEKLGYEVINDDEDIVSAIVLKDKEKLKKIVKGIQMGGAINSHFIPEEEKLPGYQNEIIMASPSFVTGSSIEVSCDGPLKEPYIAYMQGALTYEYGKIALINALKEII